jgi:hypothetical protein
MPPADETGRRGDILSIVVTQKQHDEALGKVFHFDMPVGGHHSSRVLDHFLVLRRDDGKLFK